MSVLYNLVSTLWGGSCWLCGASVSSFSHIGALPADDASTCQLAAAAGAAHTRSQRSHTHSDIAAAARTPRARVNAGRECRLPGGGAPAATAPPSPVHGRIMVLTGAQELDELHHTPRQDTRGTGPLSPRLLSGIYLWLCTGVYWWLSGPPTYNECRSTTSDIGRSGDGNPAQAPGRRPGVCKAD